MACVLSRCVAGCVWRLSISVSATVRTRSSPSPGAGVQKARRKECHRYCAWSFHRCYERATQSAQHGTLAGTAHGVTKILQTEAPLCTEASPLSVSGRRSSAATIASASVAALHPLPGRRFELVRAARDPLLKRSIRKPPGLSSPPPTPPGATDPRQHDSVYLFSPPSYPSTSTRANFLGPTTVGPTTFPSTTLHHNLPYVLHL